MRFKQGSTLFFLVLLAGYFSFFEGDPVWGGEPFVSEAIRQQSVMEYGKQVLAESGSRSDRNVEGAADVYENEGRRLAVQLEEAVTSNDLGYTIVEGDTLSIVFKDRDQWVRAAYKVSNKGEIVLPVAGSIKVSGLNRKQARDRIESLLKEYIRDPQAGIAVNTDGRIMIFGAVVRPGLFTMNGKMSLMEAVFTAGGFNKQTAEMSSVIVIRGPVEKPLVLKLNLKKMITKGDRTDDILVKPGDFIYLPTTVISSLEKFWDTASGFLMRWYGLGGDQPITGGNQWNWGGL